MLELLNRCRLAMLSYAVTLFQRLSGQIAALKIQSLRVLMCTRPKALFSQVFHMWVFRGYPFVLIKGLGNPTEKPPCRTPSYRHTHLGVPRTPPTSGVLLGFPVSSYLEVGVLFFSGEIGGCPFLFPFLFPQKEVPPRQKRTRAGACGPWVLGAFFGTFLIS